MELFILKEEKMKNYLTQNGKMKKSSGLNTYNWGIPAFKEETGRLTCPMAKDCVAGCYAKSGAYVWSNVKLAFQTRYELTKTTDFVSILDSEIKRRKSIQRVRIHDSGDFYSKQYLNDWFKIMELNPNIEFYAYTKMIKLFKDTKKFPKNFKYIYSFGGKQDNLIDVNKDKHCQIFDNKKELLDAGYIDVSNDDNLVTLLDIRLGIVFHGFKSRKWTTYKQLDKKVG